MKKIICIGSATKDVFVPIGQVKLIDNDGDLTAKKLMAFEYGAKVYASEIIEQVGGSAVNAAAGLAKTGLRSFVFSRTSKGEIGKWITKNISRLKVKKNYLQQTSGIESEVSIILLDKQSIEHVIIRTGDSTEAFDCKKALSKFREKVDWIFIGSQKKGWESSLQSILAFAKKKKAKIALNPSSFQIENDAKKLSSYFSQIDVVFVNRDEAIELVKNIHGQTRDDIKYLYDKLLPLGGKVLAITDAENGAYVGDSDSLLHLGIFENKKQDAVGAGDAFGSGFLARYIEEPFLPGALAWGMANSGSVVGQLGATRGLLNKKEMQTIEKILLPKIKNLK